MPGHMVTPCVTPPLQMSAITYMTPAWDRAYIKCSMHDGDEAPQQQLSVSAAPPGCIQELEQLRAAAQALKADVDLLHANQERQRKQEETLVLGQLKKTVQALQAESSAISDQQHAVCPSHLVCTCSSTMPLCCSGLWAGRPGGQLVSCVADGMGVASFWLPWPCRASVLLSRLHALAS